MLSVNRLVDGSGGDGLCGSGQSPSRGSRAVPGEAGGGVGAADWMIGDWLSMEGDAGVWLGAGAAAFGKDGPSGEGAVGEDENHDRFDAC
jgi:hypothetical protein